MRVINSFLTATGLFRGAVDQAVFDAELAIAHRRHDWFWALEDAFGLEQQFEQGPVHLVGGILVAEPTSINSIRLGRGRESSGSSPCSVRVGDDLHVPAKALMCADRQLTSITSPETVPTSIVSPTSNGRSIRSTRPENKLPGVPAARGRRLSR